MQRLGCLKPSFVLRVSEHVPDIVSFIQDILKSGNGYVTSAAKGGEDVWFDVGALGDLYGTFAEGRGTSAAAAAGDSVIDEDTGELKRDKRDFALWKAAKTDAEPGWDSPWGRGRPGWHIECSAMTKAAFGDSLDLHAGGIDLAFPHHENEVAQWRGAAPNGRRGEQWCGCWVHTGHLHIEGRKMSKSLKNFITVRELLDGGTCTPDDFRLFCAMHRYRSTVSFSVAGVSAASAVRLQLSAALAAARDALATTGQPNRKRLGDAELALRKEVALSRDRLRFALLDDVDTPTAVVILTQLASKIRAYTTEHSQAMIDEPLAEAASLLSETLAWRGDAPGAGAGDGADLKQALGTLVQFRAGVRNAALASKDDVSKLALRGSILQLCDDLRQGPDLASWGYALVDRADGSPLLQRASSAPSAPAAKKAPSKVVEDISKVAPRDLFQSGVYAGTFSAFDEDGFPTLDADGEVLSKSLSKKLRKKFDVHTEKWKQRAEAAEAQ
ncbi:tRNA synthetases class I (C) catalytic domain-containing protein [Pelagophyceae sp. CCMP2097]|nr:tRNA synthetases class I (C) catalytic domain-containing protein [Pelagophyceae sp. CCMP2097]